MNIKLYILVSILLITTIEVFPFQLNFNKINATKKYVILPLGNSITYDNRTNDSRNVGEKAGYRGPLYNLLNDAGYNFDFAGSEHSGGNFLPAGYDEHAGFPGITDNQLLYLLQTGHLFQPSQGIDRQITAGPYLNTFSPDYILLHIGTNENDQPEGTSSAEVEQILDLIDSYENQSGKEVTVLLARIIDRVPNKSFVNEFNNNIEAMAFDRVNNPLNDAFPDKIVIVDMQNSAGLNYIISPDPGGDSGDMHDALHPNDNGHKKMANKWFSALKSVLPSPPIILSNPTDKYVFEGDTVIFSITVESDSPVLYQWKRNGSNIPLANNSALQLNNVKLLDDGYIYSCLVTNNNGSLISKTAKLKINSLSKRVENSLVAEYDFEEGEGNIIQNKISNSGENNLVISSTESIEWISHGIKLKEASDIATAFSSSSINDSINRSNQLTVELWISTTRLNQSGPARIFTISANDNERNITIGQNLDYLNFRTRTTETDLNGLPDFSSENVLSEENIFQIVLTRDLEGWEKFYMNGVLNKSILKYGDLSNWKSEYKLALGNEFLANKPWLGNIYHIGIYNRALSEDEIQHNFILGESGVTDIESLSLKINENYILSQNYPNPFNPITTISFNLPEASNVSLTIYNFLGQKVTNIVENIFSSGNYDVKFDASNLTSGIYVYSIVAIGNSGKKFVDSKKLILLK